MILCRKSKNCIVLALYLQDDLTYGHQIKTMNSNRTHKAKLSLREHEIKGIAAYE